MMFQIAGERFRLSVGIDGFLYAVFSDEVSAEYAHGKGYFQNRPWACFGGYMNAFQLEWY
jgi:hypothetical protein